MTYAEGRLTRVVGGLDLNGAGIPHAVGNVGPFLYLDDGREIMGTHQPPFGLHPHSGVVVATYIPRGERWASVSNVPGSEYIAIHAGEVLISNAGSGIVHDERTDSDGEHELIQCVMRLPATSRTSEASFWMAQPETDGLTTHVFGPDTLRDVGVDAALDHVTLSARDNWDRVIPPTHSTGFVYVRRGAVTVAGVVVETGEIGLLSPDGDLRVAADDDSEFFVGTAAPIDEPWVKLLGHNGFVIEADADTAAAKLAQYAAAPADFPRT